MNNVPTVAVIIVAAGRGQRAGGDVPKQWRLIAGKSVLQYTLDVFASHSRVTEIVLVIADADQNFIETLTLPPNAIIAFGGAERSTSVLSGLKATQAENVLIHDAARCCVPPDVIDRVLDALQTDQAAAPALLVTDALWTGTSNHVTGVQDRSGLYRAQTPQGFKLAPIRAAHEAHGIGAADDVEIAQRAGIKVTIVQGDARNLKITTPADFKRAENLLEIPMDIRTGNGFDVHRFGEGDHVMLCGIKVPHSHGLLGHSDADVGMHTVTDAIYGALCCGDIGQHFPPNDPQWKGVSSDIFLKHACKLARKMGFDINHIDCTLICEFPKIGPVAVTMRFQMAQIMGIDVDRVSVKATTSERLGFTGRGEGIAAIATVTLMKGIAT